MILLDTCALLWWTLSPEKLSNVAQRKIDEAVESSSVGSNILVSSISIWEIGVKCKKQKLTLGITANEFTDRLSRASKVTILPVDEKIWLESIDLSWSHTDHVDRVIVATAQKMKAELLTADNAIKEFYPLTVW